MEDTIFLFTDMVTGELYAVEIEVNKDNFDGEIPNIKSIDKALERLEKSGIPTEDFEFEEIIDEETACYLGVDIF